MGSPFIIERRLFGRDGTGLCCDENGLALGPLSLVAPSTEAGGKPRYHMRAAAEIAKALELAFGPLPEEMIRRSIATFERVTRFLNAGDMGRAAIAAVQLGLPEVEADGMAKLTAASLHKYNPDYVSEPRVPATNPGAGQWTRDAGNNGSENQNDPQRRIAMSPECIEEWEQARAFCDDLIDRGLFGTRSYLGFGHTYDQCLRGQVSAACGGNPVG